MHKIVPAYHAPFVGAALTLAAVFRIICGMKVFKPAMVFAAVLAASALSGCLTSVGMSEMACWNIEYTGEKAEGSVEPRFGTVRASQVAVRAPYAVKGLAVLRANGTVAFDPYNEYAASPSALLKGAVEDALAASGLFKTVVGAASSANASLSAEVTVTRLALDCRAEGSRRAVAELDVCLVDRHSVVARAKGSGAADAADGKYGAAFSGAVSDALVEAMKRLGPRN